MCAGVQPILQHNLSILKILTVALKNMKKIQMYPSVCHCVRVCGGLYDFDKLTNPGFKKRLSVIIWSSFGSTISCFLLRWGLSLGTWGALSTSWATGRPGTTISDHISTLKDLEVWYTVDSIGLNVDEKMILFFSWYHSFTQLQQPQQVCFIN